MKVRRCDACGAIGENPYEGWLRVSTFALEDYEDEDRTFRIGTSRRPVLTFEVCSHGCLPGLAFERSAEFALKVEAS